jgi:hypothetical protein
VDPDPEARKIKISVVDPDPLLELLWIRSRIESMRIRIQAVYEMRIRIQAVYEMRIQIRIRICNTIGIKW